MLKGILVYDHSSVIAHLKFSQIRIFFCYKGMIILPYSVPICFIKINNDCFKMWGSSEILAF